MVFKLNLALDIVKLLLVTHAVIVFIGYQAIRKSWEKYTATCGDQAFESKEYMHLLCFNQTELLACAQNKWLSFQLLKVILHSFRCIVNVTS